MPQPGVWICAGDRQRRRLLNDVNADGTELAVQCREPISLMSAEVADASQP